MITTIKWIAPEICPRAKENILILFGRKFDKGCEYLIHPGFYDFCHEGCHKHYEEKFNEKVYRVIYYKHLFLANECIGEGWLELFDIIGWCYLSDAEPEGFEY